MVPTPPQSTSALHITNMNTNTTPHAEQRDGPPSALALSKSKLGNNAYLLDFLPVDEMQIVPQTEVQDHVPFKIKVRTPLSEADGVKLPIWA
jgi:hypothetical protein